MSTIAITGSAGGIGLATTRLLESQGDRVIGIDVRDAEVLADLTTADGRTAMVSSVASLCNGALDGLVAAAGIQGDDGPMTVSINYFGAVASLAGLRPLLERGTDASAVAVASNSMTTQPAYPMVITDACLADDEPGAQAVAEGNGMGAYPASKLGLARWVRRQATTENWIGSGIRLNAIAPGFIETPLTEGMWQYVEKLGDIYPMPSGRAGRAEEVAGLLAYLLSPAAGFFCGSVITMDGGTEAALRPDDWPVPLTH